MEIFLISFGVLLLAVLGMAVGAMFGKTSLKGSCGGLNTLMGLGLSCQVCEKPCESHDTSSSLLCPLNSHRSAQSCEHTVLRSKI